VAKLTKKKASSPEVSKQHSSNEFMNFFTYKIDNIREILYNYTAVYYSIAAGGALSSPRGKICFIYCYRRGRIV